MGHFETTVNGLIAKQGKEPFTLTESGKNAGQFVVNSAKIMDVDGVTSKLSGMSVSQAKTTPTTTPTATPTFVQPQINVPRDIPIVSCTPTPSVMTVQPQIILKKERSVTTPTPTPTSSFMDYISGGCEISLCVAIDFTGSNGDPRVPGTLHHMTRDGTKNCYEKAITAVSKVLAPYDMDQKFPVWGFGAKLGGKIDHCFQVGPKAEVDGVDGIIQAYRQVFASGITMSGPTDITEVVQTAAAFSISGQVCVSLIYHDRYCYRLFVL